MLPLLIGGATVLILMNKKKTPKNTSTSVGSDPSRNTNAQSGYPWQQQTPPRVDASNQPWYAGPANFAAGASENYAATIALKNSSSIVNSLSDIWGHLKPGSSETPASGSTDSHPSESVAAPYTLADTTPDGKASVDSYQYGLDVNTDLTNIQPPAINTADDGSGIAFDTYSPDGYDSENYSEQFYA